MSERLILRGIAFTWDRTKAETNRLKHGIELAVSCEAFFDPFFCVEDAGIRHGEGRQALLGMTLAWRLLYVVFHEAGDEIRIISARLASAAERKRYEDQ